ncbi:MAG: HAD-IB family phosphatase, partial [Raineya sp.]|nr:HAD-IB family phosphatase [Raineya sp.]
MKNYIIIDFDSTFTQVEGLDELARIALQDVPDGTERIRRIEQITHAGMEGKISFAETLRERVGLLKAHQKHIQELINLLKTKVSPSIQRNKQFFEQFSDNILIISSGFREFIVPIVSEYGIKPENVFANSFIFDENGNIIGYDTENLLAQNEGKVLQLKVLNLTGEIYVIGDGYTDYQMREAGLANRFYAFTENVKRESVTAKADYVLPNLD